MFLRFIPLILCFQPKVPLWFFSGTLSYIFNNFKNGRLFSEVVAEARDAGYTEPDPRDDLSGTDVARKVHCTVFNISKGCRLPHFLVTSMKYKMLHEVDISRLSIEML